MVATPGQGPDRPQEVSYTDTKVIGNGSFGVVYQAKLCDSGELVAIKKVLQDKRFKVREKQGVHTHTRTYTMCICTIHTINTIFLYVFFKTLMLTLLNMFIHKYRDGEVLVQVGYTAARCLIF